MCPWKGTASYYDVVVGDAVNKDAAWYYPDTKDAAKHIAGRIAFWKGVKVDALGPGWSRIAARANARVPEHDRRDQRQERQRAPVHDLPARAPTPARRTRTTTTAIVENMMKSLAPCVRAFSAGV